MQKKHSERGSQMVETSLILLTFLLMLIGTIDFGQVLYFHQSLVERARAAARYGAINPTDPPASRTWRSITAQPCPLRAGPCSRA